MSHGAFNTLKVEIIELASGTADKVHADRKPVRLASVYAAPAWELPDAHGNHRKLSEFQIFLQICLDWLHTSKYLLTNEPIGKKTTQKEKVPNGSHQDSGCTRDQSPYNIGLHAHRGRRTSLGNYSRGSRPPDSKCIAGAMQY